MKFGVYTCCTIEKYKDCNGYPGSFRLELTTFDACMYMKFPISCWPL